MDTSLWDCALKTLPKEDQSVLATGNDLPAPQILSDILKLINEQSDRCQHSTYKTPALLGRKFVIRDICAKIVSCINSFVGVVDVIVSYDPAHAALPWAAVRLVLQVCLSTFQTFDQIVEGLHVAVRLIARGEILEAMYFTSPSDPLSNATLGLKKQLIQGYEKILRFLVHAKRYSAGSRFRRLLSLISKESFTTLVDGMGNAEQMILVDNGLADTETLQRMQITTRDVGSSVVVMGDKMVELKSALDSLAKPMIRAVDQISTIYTALKDNERTQMMQWASTTPAERHYKTNLAGLAPGSGQWLIQSSLFAEWRDSSTSAIFWLRGNPGCGKSKLAAVVVEHLRFQNGVLSSSVPIASFFCCRNPAEPDRGNANDILRSLVKQLSFPNDLVRKPLVEKYRKFCEDARCVGESPVTLNVEQCTDLLCDLGRSAPITIVIDGLDECTATHRTTLLDALKKVFKGCRDLVKIFISSRWETDIAAILTPVTMMDVKVTDTEEDLKTFVEIEVGKFIQKRSSLNMMRLDEENVLKTELSKALIGKSQGMFIWVILQLALINDTSKVKTLQDIRQALKTLPPTLAKVYRAINCRIEEQGTEPRSVAQLTLHWLLGGNRLLSTAELIAAVGFQGDANSSAIDTILDYCCHMVVLDASTDSFRLAHHTAREFLEDLDSYSPPEFNLSISRRCLDVYLRDESNSPLLSYATTYWAVHVERLREDCQNAKIQDSLLEFFTKEEHFEDWLDALETILPNEKKNGLATGISANLEASFSSRASPLFLISCFGLHEVLREIKHEIMGEIDLPNRHGSTSVYLAAYLGHYEVLKLLLELGANSNGLGSKYPNALQAACVGGWGRIVSLLVENGATMGAPLDGTFSSALQASIIHDHDAIADYLIDNALSGISGCLCLCQKQLEDVLQAAIFKGNIPVVSRLIRSDLGQVVDQPRPDTLEIALAAGKLRESERLIRGCSDINNTNGIYGNALTAAIASGKLSLVQLVLKWDVRIDIPGNNGYPLRCAALVGNLEIASLLLERGADPNTKDEAHGDPLQTAATRGDVDMMLLLLDRRADPSGNGGHFGNTVQAAAFGGHHRAVQLLLERGAESSPGKYRDALQAAVYADREDMVEMLVTEYNLDPKHDLRHQHRSMSGIPRPPIPSSAGFIQELDVPINVGPLEVASRRGNLDLVVTLLGKGAPLDFPDLTDTRGCSPYLVFAYTALQISAFWGHASVVEYLLSRGADVNASRYTLGFPLQAALEGGQTHVADILLCYGAHIEKYWGDFGSCLQIYAERGNYAIVEFLIKSGANINDPGGVNGSALQVACGAGHIQVVQLLLDNGADANAKGKGIGTALQAASAAGHTDIVELLLRGHLEIDDERQDLSTALCCAALYGLVAVICLLLIWLFILTPEGLWAEPMSQKLLRGIGYVRRGIALVAQ